MVTQYGMSEKLRPRTFGRKEELVFLGREISEQRNYSEKVAEDIDVGVRRIIQEAYDTAESLLTLQRATLDSLAEKLMAQETLEGEELEAIFRAGLGPTEQEKDGNEMAKADKLVAEAVGEAASG